MAKKAFAAHNDATILKHLEVYEAYVALCQEIREKYPEVAEFVARAYFYQILSDRFGLTPNYVCAIICNVMSNRPQMERMAAIARMNLEQDEEGAGKKCNSEENGNRTNHPGK